MLRSNFRRVRHAYHESSYTLIVRVLVRTAHPAWQLSLSTMKNTNKDDITRKIQAICKHLVLNHKTRPVVDATDWFLGPKAENRALMEAQMTKALQANFQSREEYEPDDPHFNNSPADQHLSQRQSDAVGAPMDKLLALLKDSLPMASYRNQSHMNWDITMPGVIGYVAAMLYNQNNVAAEASPVTTALEIIVGNDLCRMLGFEAQTPSSGKAIIPWGHITCDGSVANGEAMWAARNLSYLPISLAAAIRLEPDMKAAHTVTVFDPPPMAILSRDPQRHVPPAGGWRQQA